LWDAGAQAQLRPTGWRALEIPQSRTRSTIRPFLPLAHPKVGLGAFQSHNLGATLLVYSQPRKAGETPISHLQANLCAPG
jgi:hypothetical protein